MKMLWKLHCYVVLGDWVTLSRTDDWSVLGQRFQNLTLPSEAVLP